jgi:hypothetical protein
MDKKLLSFSFNGVVEEAFAVPEDTWYPFFALGQFGKSVAVVREVLAIVKL